MGSGELLAYVRDLAVQLVYLSIAIAILTIILRAILYGIIVTALWAIQMVRRLCTLVARIPR